MTSSSARGTKTILEQWLELPEHVVGEIINGELYVSPRPGLEHAVASSSIGDELVGPFQKGRGGPGGWWIVFEPEIHFETNILVPDLAGWRRERVPGGLKGPFTELAPDWVCEVVSPSTAGTDRVKKMPLYAHFGVKHIWIVDPLQKTLEVFMNDHAQWKLIATHSAKEKVRAAPFDAIEINLPDLWPEPARES